MEVDIKHLKLILALKRKGNMTQAAEELFLTQSALSHQLKAVEEAIGTPLFERKSKRLFLTNAGNQFAALAQNTLNQLNEGLCSIRSEAQIEPQLLRVRAGCFTSYSWLPDVVKSYSEAEPLVKIELSTSWDNSLIKLKRSEIDVAFVTDEVKDRSLAYETLFEDELLLVMSPTDPLAKYEKIHPKDLDGKNIVIFNISDKDSTLISGVMKPAGARPARVTRMDMTEGIVGLIKTGYGIGLLASWIAAPHIKSGALVGKSIKEKGVKRIWKTVVRKDSLNKKHIVAFLKSVRSHVHLQNIN